jgi:hypothetical protein
MGQLPGLLRLSEPHTKASPMHGYTRPPMKDGYTEGWQRVVAHHRMPSRHALPMKVRYRKCTNQQRSSHHTLQKFRTTHR